MTETPVVTDEPVIVPNPDRARRGGNIFGTSSDAPKTNVKRSRVPNVEPGTFVEPVEDFYMWLAMGIAPFRETTADAITDEVQVNDEETSTVARECAKKWDALAQKNDRVRAFLLKLTQGGDWSALVVAHLPILFTLIPPSLFARVQTMMFKRMMRNNARDESSANAA